MNATTQLLSCSTAYCATCRASHRSFYEVVAGTVVYSIECPRGRNATLVSSDSALFTAIRDRRPRVQPSPAAADRRFHFYVIALTDRCDFECPICYAECGADGQRFLSLDELRRAALLVKAGGGKRLSLSGGEPTLHPQLCEMIRMVRQDIGLSPVLVTNGLRIAEDEGFLLKLKQAGLRRVHLQFDTLDNRTYRAMRGRHDVREKLRAVERIVSAGLRLGLIATVCDLNLGEAGELLEYAQHLVPALRILVFQPMVPAGRFPLQRQSVTREDIIRSLVGSAGKYELHEADFAPFPGPGSDHATAHPDCSAHVLMYSDGDHSSAFRPSCGDWSSSPARAGIPSATGLLGSEILPAEVVRRLRQDRLHKAGAHPFFLSIIAFMRPQARDDERLERCIVASVTEQGLVPVCQQGCSGATRPFAGSCQGCEF